MDESEGVRILAAMNRQREALARESRRYPDSAGFPIPEMIGRAATLMRERAEQANSDAARRPYGDSRCDPVPEQQWGEMVDNYLGGVVGQHCASWTPAVALAVADWLEIGANPYACVDLGPMAAVARAYLGEPVTGSQLEDGRIVLDVDDQCPTCTSPYRDRRFVMPTADGTAPCDSEWHTHACDDCATTAPKVWTCACGYMNSGGICTHCGALCGEPYEGPSVTGPKPLISPETIAEAEAMEERDRRAGGFPWEVPDHPDHQLPGGWHRGKINTGTAPSPSAGGIDHG
jgi:hypothetical protein